MFFAFVAFGFFVLLVAGAIAGVYSVVKLRSLIPRLGELERRLNSQEPGSRVEPGPEALPETPPPASGIQDPQWQSGADSTVGPAPDPTRKVVEPPRKVPAAPPPIEGSSSDLDWESLIAGRWLNRIGVVAVLLATAFFLKFAFDNDWVGPLGRVAIGLVAGTGLIAASQWLLAKGYHYFSEGITALGAGVLYLSLFAAWDFYQLIPQTAAFGGMVIVTAAVAALAWGRDSQRLAILALVGGLSTPFLLSTDVDRQVTRFSYFAILVGGFVALAWGKKWRSVAPVALSGVLIYFVGWFDQFYKAPKLLVTLLFASLFFVEFALPSVASVVSRNRLRLDEMLLVVANGAWFGVALHALLFPEHTWWLTVAVLVLGAIHLIVARSVRGGEATAEESESAQPGRPETARFLYAAVALGFVTAAIPIRLEGDWIRAAWAVEGAFLVWAGLRGGVQALRWAGVALMGLATFLLLDFLGGGDRLFLNPRFLSFVAVAGSLAAAFFWVRNAERGTRADQEGAIIARNERLVFGAVGIAGNAVAVWGLSEEVWRFLGRQQWNLEPRLARQMGLSLLWTVLAAVLIFWGVRAGSKALRWQGLALLGLTIFKVFLVDLSFLEQAYRIVSFMALGLVLLVVSFFYQRSLKREREESG